MSSFGADFDPQLVPRWPRLTLEIHGSGDPLRYRGELGGRPIPLDDAVDTSDPYQVIEAAVDHAVTVIAARGWDTCRVSAVDPDGHTWPMILGANGERYDLTEQDRHDKRAAAAGNPMRRVWLALAAAIVIPGLIVGGLLVGRHLARPAPIAAGPYTPQIAELPVPAPAGWTTHAAWHLSDLDTTTAVVHNDAVWTIAGGSLLALRTDTGQQIGHWPVGSSVQGPWLTTVEGKTVVAAASASTVIWVDTATNPQATTHPLPTGSRVDATTTGLWWTHNNDAWVAAGTPLRRTIPADATIADAEGGTLIALDPLGRLWRLDNDGIQTPDPIQLSTPPGAHTFQQVLTVTNKTVVTAWDGDGRAVVAFHSTSGQPQAAITTDRSLTGQSRGDKAHPRMLTIGSTIIDTQQRRVSALPRDINVSAVIDGLAFGRRGDEAVTVDLATAAIRHSARTTSQPASAVGRAGTRLLVVDHQSLYSLEPA